MVTKSKSASVKKSRKADVGKLRLKKDTLRNLSEGEKKGVKGGALPTTSRAISCAGCVAKQN